ncbi:SRPBCC family protein [Kribbella hippodromi]|uniref:SRPBCC family protein n=1 Tax=Kribbella hippodromi TaxID=434347 RepID=A0ABN2EJR6_9ACTN
MSRSIQREIQVDAGPEVVYQVISAPHHLQRWGPDRAEFEAVPGASGVVVFRRDDGDKVEPLTIVDADPPRRFSYRWSYTGDVPTAANSLLVSFELMPVEGGTVVRFAETGYDEAGKADQTLVNHTAGWDHYLPRLAPYAAEVARS